MTLRISRLGIAVALLAFVTVLSFLGEYFSIGDRLSHFRFYWAIVAGGVAIAAILQRRWLLGGLTGVVFFAHAVPAASLWFPDGRISRPDEKAGRLNVVSVNLYASNARKPEALARLLDLSPDLLVLMEVGREWRPALKPVLEAYPHHLGTDGNIWLLSRNVLRHANATPIKAADYFETNAVLEATVMVSGSSIRVVAIHGPRPTGDAGIAHQRSLAAAYKLALDRDRDASHRLLIGDLNTTPFSAVFGHIVQTTGLRDAAIGWGYHPTWGPRLPREPFLPWLGIPIDHALVSDEVAVEDRRVGEMPGADHRYQLIKLRF